MTKPPLPSEGERTCNFCHWTFRDNETLAAHVSAMHGCICAPWAGLSSHCPVHGEFEDRPRLTPTTSMEKEDGNLPGWRRPGYGSTEEPTGGTPTAKDYGEQPQGAGEEASGTTETNPQVGREALPLTPSPIQELVARLRDWGEHNRFKADSESNATAFICKEAAAALEACAKAERIAIERSIQDSREILDLRVERDWYMDKYHKLQETKINPHIQSALDLEKAEAEIARLRAALEKIASHEYAEAATLILQASPAPPWGKTMPEYEADAEICCPHCRSIIPVEIYNQHGMCRHCLNLRRGNRLCPGDSSKTVAQCVVGGECGCDERDPRAITHSSSSTTEPPST